MNKQELRSYIQQDIKRLEKEQKKATPKQRRGNETPYILDYIIARKHTLKEILTKI